MYIQVIRAGFLDRSVENLVNVKDGKSKANLMYPSMSLRDLALKNKFVLYFIV